MAQRRRCLSRIGLFVIGKGTENSLPSGPTDYADENDAGKYSDAVDRNISCGRAAAGDKGLMVFVESGKTDAEYTCDEHEC